MVFKKKLNGFYVNYPFAVDVGAS